MNELNIETMTDCKLDRRLAQVRAAITRIACGGGGAENSARIRKLEREEDAIWDERIRRCRVSSREIGAREAIKEYADHQSWRCGHPDRYPWEPDCPCGLTKVLRDLGIEYVVPPTRVVQGG